MRSDADVLAAFDATLASLAHRNRNVRLAIVEHITSKPSLLLPIKRIVERLCDRRVPVLVDGAHCPGQVHTLPTHRAPIP